MSDPGRFLLSHDRAVQAGAGTGKTHALVTQYLHLCAGLSAHPHAMEPRQIAAMTFTEKAAGEMLERLRQRAGHLIRATLSGEDAVRTAEPDLYRSAQALSRSMPDAAHWERVLVQLGSAPVGTFHSFAGSLIRRYPAHAGIDPDFVMLDEETAREMALESAERVVLSALEGRLADRGVSAEEAAQVVAEYGFRGVAGGSALVDFLCQVQKRRAEEGLLPAGLAESYGAQVLDRELIGVRDRLLQGLGRLKRVADLLGPRSMETAAELARGEAHIAAALLDLAGLKEAIPLSEAVCGGLSRLRTRVGDEAGRQTLADVKEALRQGHRDLLALLGTQQAAPLAQAFERLCAACRDAYEERKRRAFSLDFTDLLYRARDLLRAHPTAREQVQKRFQAVLVDEFQDTNPLQADLLQLVAGGPEERREGPGKLYIVGDRKQSIYEFRGADVATFAHLCSAIVAAGGDEEMLTVSRRSLPGVLSLVNGLFARVMQAPPMLAEVPAWIIGWDPDRDVLLPLRQEEPQGPAAELLCQDEAAPGPESPEEDPLGREAEMVARHIRALQKGGRRFGDMAILLRRFTHLDRYLLALRQKGIPHYVVKGRGFYDAQEIRDLTAALTLIDDPDDVLALVSVLRSPLCGLSDDSLVHLHLGGHLRLSALFRREPDRPLPEGIPPDEIERIEQIVALFSMLTQKGDRLGPAGCLRALYDASDLQAVLVAAPEGEQRVANLEMLLSRAQEFEETGGNLRAFVRWLRVLVDPSLGGDALSPQAQIVDERDDVVRVMTVHQAKGLEFPVVFIPGCAAPERHDVAAISYDREVGLGLSLRRGGERQDTLPKSRIRQMRRLRSEAESARLFYVAVTRARDRVIFAGEGRKPGRRGTWRAHLDELLSSPEGRLLVPHDPLAACVPERAPAEVPDLASDPRAEKDLAQAAAAAVARAYRLSPLLAQTGSMAGPLRLTVSAACDLSLCPRRFQMMHGLSLAEQHRPDESPARARASEEDLFASPQERLHHGTLAQHLLSRADFAQQGADLEGLLAADGYDPAHPVVAEIRTRVARLLRTRWAQELDTSPEALRRALPFRLRLPTIPQVELRGVMDLLIVEPSGPALTVIDYHYSYLPAAESTAEEGPLQRLRRGLLGLSARRMVAGASRVRIGFAYLREPDPSPRVRDSLPQDEEWALRHLQDGLPAALLDGGDALRLLPLPVARCTQLGCGYRYRCHVS